jgi:hypothetical protein
LFAGNDHQQTFVARSFSGISFRNLPGYEVRYGRASLMPALIRQLPGLIIKVRREHAWLRELALQEKIDGVISDNRYGLWHSGIPSVILTHQAEIQTGLGQWADGLLRRIHYRFLGRFSECWIVDVPGGDNLGGRLSHPQTPPPRSRFIGWLSQFSPAIPTAPEQHLLVLLSGPEPQRSILSDKLWLQASWLKVPVVFVEGSASAVRKEGPPHIRHYPRLGGAELRELLERASLVVCRSGYSTLMDLLLLRKKAILIPTPGQTEQEYLARKLHHQGVYYSEPQKEFYLEAAIEASHNFPFRLPDADAKHELFEAVVDEWVGRI